MVYTFGYYSAVSLFASALRLGEKHKTTANWQAICASQSASVQLRVLL